MFALGCQQEAEKPKRADDAAAHGARWHPDVDRSQAGTSRPADELATLPADWDRIGPGPIGSPVVFVNGKTLTVSEVLEPIIDELARQAKALSDRDYRESVVKLVRNQMDYQVSLLLVYDEAQKQYGDKKFQEAFDKHVDEQIKSMLQHRFGGVRARYEAHLKAMDMTADEMKERLKREIMVREFLHERFRPMLKEPPRRELFSYYQGHLADYTAPEKTELLLIEAPIEAELGKPLATASLPEVATARQQARSRLSRAREELESGVDFATVARAYSRGPMAQQGGNWGEIAPGSLTKRWAQPAEMVFKMQPGQMSGIVEADEMFFIVKCGRKTPSQRLSFEEAQRKITEHLLEEQFTRLRNEYIGNLLDRATIKKRPEFFQALLAAVPRQERAAEGADARERGRSGDAETR